ncbi:conserved hypothetical protein [Echinococcus multilocularis]|uniref:Uncharacterized protein n=1 Tax=Echinococcus multilocularis TaxID=6211 RepID=A0A068Y1B5_ECHMU|nr:conserved hypothetical protein [Echinococcus multilocularis]
MKPELKRQNTTRQLLTRKVPARRPALSTGTQKDCARLLNDLLVSEDIIQSIYKNISSQPAVDNIIRPCSSKQKNVSNSVSIPNSSKSSSKKSTPRIIDEELSKEFPTVSDALESPIDFANLLQRIKSVAKILRDADLEFLANDAEEAASRILKTNLVHPQVAKSSRACQTPTETRSVQSSTTCDVEVGVQYSPVHAENFEKLEQNNGTLPGSTYSLNSTTSTTIQSIRTVKNSDMTSAQSTTGGNLSSQLKSLSLTLNRQQVEYEKQRLEMNQKELAFRSNLDAMVDQLRNLVTENANLRHQLASKDAQLTSLGRLVQNVTTKLSQASSTRAPDAGDLLENPTGSTVSHVSLPHHILGSPPNLTFLRCPSRNSDLSLTPKIVPFEGLEDIDNDNITSVSAVESRRCDQTNFEGKNRSPSASSLSSLRTADMMQFRRGLAALDDQIAKLRDSLHRSG